MQVPFFGRIISRNSVKPDHGKLKSMIEIPPPKKPQKDLHVFLGIINSLSKFPPSTADICKALRQLTSVKTEWTWNADYQKLFERAKSIIKADACMEFYDGTKSLYLETDASEGGLGTGLLQTRNCTSCPRHMAPDNNILIPMAFTKSLSSAEEIQQCGKRSIR